MQHIVANIGFIMKKTSLILISILMTSCTKFVNRENTGDTAALTRNIRALNTECDMLNDRLVDYETALVKLKNTTLKDSGVQRLKSDINKQHELINRQQEAIRILQDKLDKLENRRYQSQTTNKVITNQKTYVVKKGDTLTKIASKTNTKLTELRRMNNIKDDKIYIGQQLVISS